MVFTRGVIFQTAFRPLEAPKSFCFPNNIFSVQQQNFLNLRALHAWTTKVFGYENQTIPAALHNFYLRQQKSDCDNQFFLSQPIVFFSFSVVRAANFTTFLKSTVLRTCVSKYYYASPKANSAWKFQKCPKNSWH